MPRGKTEHSARDIFDEHADYVWRTLRYLGVPEADLPDLSQEVFVVVHRKLGEFEGRSSMRTWLHGICKRVAAARRRKAHVRRERLDSTPPDATLDASQDEALARRQQLQILQRILSELDDDKRAVFVLFEIEGMPMKEVAQTVGCPLQTAYSRLKAAREEVRRRFAKAVAA